MLVDLTRLKERLVIVDMEFLKEMGARDLLFSGDAADTGSGFC